MKSTNYYVETVPVFIRYIRNLRSIISKGEVYLNNAEVKLTETEILNAQLAPDMFIFQKQVGYVYFTVLETIVNLTGREMPTFTYDEASLKELNDSLVRVEEFLNSISESEMEIDEEKFFKTFLHPTQTFSPKAYVRELALPNFFFHVTTAYDILRHLGVPLGKDDYLGLSK